MDQYNIKGKSDCDICGGRGYTLNAFGMKERCHCTLAVDKPKEKVEYMDVSLVKNLHYKEMINKVIPKTRLKDDYSLAYFDNNVEMMLLRQNCRLVGENEYKAVINKLLNEAAVGNIKQSYLLSAPNNFGKTTLVHTLLKRYIYKDKSVVPYINLSQLAILRLSYEEAVKARLWGSTKDEKSVNGFTWQDWITADFVAVKLTETDSAVVESAMLASLLNRRGENDLPTLVTMQYPVRPYTENLQLKRTYWDNILAYNEIKTGTDRLIYKCTYKQYIK